MKTQQTAPPKLFIGIDIHKRSWKVHCATDLSCGRIFSMSPDPECLRNMWRGTFRAMKSPRLTKLAAAVKCAPQFWVLWLAEFGGEPCGYIQAGQGAPYQDGSNRRPVDRPGAEGRHGIATLDWT